MSHPASGGPRDGVRTNGVATEGPIVRERESIHMFENHTSPNNYIYIYIYVYTYIYIYIHIYIYIERDIDSNSNSNSTNYSSSASSRGQESPKITEPKFRNHCAKKLDGALRKSTSFV